MIYVLTNDKSEIWPNADGYEIGQSGHLRVTKGGNFVALYREMEWSRVSDVAPGRSTLKFDALVEWVNRREGGAHLSISDVIHSLDKLGYLNVKLED